MINKRINSAVNFNLKECVNNNPNITKFTYENYKCKTILKKDGSNEKNNNETSFMRNAEEIGYGKIFSKYVMSYLKNIKIEKKEKPSDVLTICEDEVEYKLISHSHDKIFRTALDYKEEVLDIINKHFSNYEPLKIDDIEKYNSSYVSDGETKKFRSGCCV